MLRSHPVRRFVFSTSLVITCGVSGILGLAQTVAPKPASTLPPTAPTSAPAPQTAPLSATPTQPDAATRAHRAEVRCDAGLISINANNSSLNQILREISRQTGMKITGGVKDERVFGHYGPAPTSVILATLIDGNSTNMVLLQTASNMPEELILTPRAGGVSPPNPNAPGFDESNGDDEERDRPQPPQRAANPGLQNQPPATVSVPAPVPAPVQALTPNPGSVPPSIPQPANNVNGSPSNTSPTAATLPVTNSVPIDSIPTPSTTAPANGIVDAPNPPDPGTVNPVTTNPPADPNQPSTDPNAPKTAEDYARELQKLQQQRQQQQQQPKSTTITPQ
jgi:hypothetical protein